MAMHDPEPFERLIQGADLPPPTASQPGDLGRLSVEAMQSQLGSPRENWSHGSVRFSGAGVIGHQVELDGVGQIATHWQRCVSALTGFQSAFGRVPQHISSRTQLMLDAAPAPGSLVLNLTPKMPPTIEAFPNNEVLLVGDHPRPLADQACAALLELLGRASTTTLPEQDALSERFRELGPRVSTSVKTLAEALVRAHVDIEMEWMEPERPTVRASLPVSAAGWIREFVTGRELDEEELTLIGVVRTVSDIAKWSVETAERLEQVDASRLPVEVVHSTKVGDEIRLLVLARMTERPDGTVRREINARQVLAPEGQG